MCGSKGCAPYSNPSTPNVCPSKPVAWAVACRQFQNKPATGVYDGCTVGGVQGSNQTWPVWKACSGTDGRKESLYVMSGDICQNPFLTQDKLPDTVPGYHWDAKNRQFVQAMNIFRNDGINPDPVYDPYGNQVYAGSLSSGPNQGLPCLVNVQTGKQLYN